MLPDDSEMIGNLLIYRLGLFTADVHLKSYLRFLSAGWFHSNRFHFNLFGSIMIVFWHFGSIMIVFSQIGVTKVLA